MVDNTVCLFVLGKPNFRRSTHWVEAYRAQDGKLCIDAIVSSDRWRWPERLRPELNSIIATVQDKLTQHFGSEPEVLGNPVLVGAKYFAYAKRAHRMRYPIELKGKDFTEGEARRVARETMQLMENAIKEAGSEIEGTAQQQETPTGESGHGSVGTQGGRYQHRRPSGHER